MNAQAHVVKNRWTGQLVRAVVAAMVAAIVLVIAAGCTSGATTALDIDSNTVIVDVRTPSEYAGGHLEGAVNLNLQDAGFSAAVAELDPDAQYVVYCRSGNRSAQAATVMTEAGLSVVDAGSVDAAAAATGLPIVP